MDIWHFFAHPSHGPPKKAEDLQSLETENLENAIAAERTRADIRFEISALETRRPVEHHRHSAHRRS